LEYEETDKHIILKRGTAQSWYASGYVYDRLTGEKLSNASVYEKRQLVSTMTNVEGYYRLKLKDKNQSAQISISKAWYIDTTITVKPATEQELTVSIAPREMVIDTVEINPEVEGTWLGKLFTSSRQKMQSLNVGDFFVDMPVQTSFVPGLGTHGRMSQHVVNNFSLNIVGGLTAGTEGVEIGCVFNINKKDAKYVQIAGAFNLVGGNVYGTQIGGMYNHVLDSLEGVQVTGFGNVVDGAVDGAQIAGFSNYARDHVKGSQVSGFANVSKGTTNGSQIAGFGNYSRGKMDGVQISAAANIAKEMNGTQIGGIFNYAKKLDGLQIGIFNYADTSSGFSLGFLSFVRKGYHKASISTNEVFNANAAFKTGNNKYYSILFLSANLGKNEAYSYGYGVGTEIKLAKKLNLVPEVSAHYLYLGGWDVNIMGRGTVSLQYKFSNWLSVFAGPAYSYYYTDQTAFYADFKAHPVPAGYKVETINSNWSSWVGWNVGMNIF
ncbi:MAG TPA: carboxypeptidase-like regulatory domain-containing protein, partial [Flavipsychrobacter sp.]|nr:carboxypeptidase-like regulatory domain-containing protein [Flavipsychrobacter sp.]